MNNHLPRRYLRCLVLASFVFPGICLALTPTLKVAVETPQRPVVVGETNLPDGTDLLLTISRRESKFEAQATVKVSGGRFRSNQFSQKGGDFNPGKYALEIVMPVAQVQSDAVRAVIGQRGEKLSGPLVDRSGIGPSVRYVTTFQNGGAANAKADSAARAREKDDRARWAVQSCHDMAKMLSPSLPLDRRQNEIEKCVAQLKSTKR